MPIKFHCEHCGKKVTAPDNAGGKRGKCPSCKQRIFIPMPEEELEEIPLAPEDPEEEKRRKQIQKELLMTQQALLDDQKPPEIEPPSKPETVLPVDENSLADIIPTEDKILQYIILMGRGMLDDAEDLANEIVAEGKKAKKIVQKMASRELRHPELKDVPQTVIAGFFKKLLGKF